MAPLSHSPGRSTQVHSAACERSCLKGEAGHERVLRFAEVTASDVPATACSVGDEPVADVDGAAFEDVCAQATAVHERS